MEEKIKDIQIEKYSENLSDYINKTHEAVEGRYELTGYDLNVIEAGLQQLLDLQSSQDKKIEKLIEKYKLKNDILIFIIDSNFNKQWLHEVSITFRVVIDDLKQLIK